MGNFNHSLVKRFWFLAILAAGALALVWPAPAEAGRRSMDFQGKWWRNPHIAERLDISDHEKSSLDDMYLDFKTESIDLRASKMKNRYKLEHLLEKSKLDEEAARNQIDKVVENGSSLDRLRYGFVLAVRKLLGADRFSAFKETYENKNRWSPRQGQAGPVADGAEPKAVKDK